MKLKGLWDKMELEFTKFRPSQKNSVCFYSCNRNYIPQTGSALALISLDLRKAFQVMSHMENFHQDRVRWNC